MEIHRSDKLEFQKLGQTYMTTCKLGIVKGWHYHRLQWDHFAPIKGNAFVGVYDAREGSPTKRIAQEVEVWEKEPRFVKIPLLAYHGFTPLDRQEIRVMNTPTELYYCKQPGEHRKDWDDPEMGYLWHRKKRLSMKTLITGGAGLIGCSFMHRMLKEHPDDWIVVLGKLTYAGRLEDIEEAMNRIMFINRDKCDKDVAKKATDWCPIPRQAHLDASVRDPLEDMEDVHGSRAAQACGLVPNGRAAA